jgi:hypothetical protein
METRPKSSHAHGIRKYNRQNAERPTHRYGDSALMGSKHNF